MISLFSMLVRKDLQIGNDEMMDVPITSLRQPLDWPGY